MKRNPLLPEHMRYRPPEWWRERYRQYGLDFGRWANDPRWRMLETPRPLPWLECKMIDRALGRRRTKGGAS